MMLTLKNYVKSIMKSTNTYQTRPMMSDVERRWRFVPKFIQRWLYVDRMIWQLNFYNQELPKIYCEVTGNRLSYPDYDAATVISVHREYMEYEREVWEEDLRSEWDGE